ncbi:MAG: hypothetical protein LBF92_01890 [Synergistaceae bacterium]|jgi:hypothetical protein|nr:hypothetical protein [Synergistaceae bacterium]
MVQIQTRDALVFTMAGRSLDHEKGSVAIMKRLKVLVSALAALAIFTGGAAADVVYTATNGSNSSIGIIISSDKYEISKHAANFGPYAKVFSFRDDKGNDKILVNDYLFLNDDRVYIYTPGKGDKAEKDSAVTGATNIYGVATIGQYLYFVGYESYDDEENLGSGKVVRVDMDNDYQVVGNPFELEDSVFKNKDGWTTTGVSIKEYADKIYVVTQVHDASWTTWAQGEVIALEPDLKEAWRRKIGVNAGGTSEGITLYDDKLYIGCIGGKMGDGKTGEYWEVDLSEETSEKIIDLSDEKHNLGYPYGGAGIAIDEDGNAMLMLLNYYIPDENSPYDIRMRPRLYFASVEGMVADGSIGAEVSQFTGKEGSSWGVSYDESTKTFWCMAGKELIAFNKDGSQKQEFSRADLGDDIYSVAVVGPIQDAGGSGESDNGPGGGGGCDTGLLGGLGLLALLALRVSQASTASSKCRRG